MSSRHWFIHWSYTLVWLVRTRVILCVHVYVWCHCYRCTRFTMRSTQCWIDQASKWGKFSQSIDYDITRAGMSFIILTPSNILSLITPNCMVRECISCIHTLSTFRESAYVRLMAVQLRCKFSVLFVFEFHNLSDAMSSLFETHDMTNIIIFYFKCRVLEVSPSWNRAVWSRENWMRMLHLRFDNPSDVIYRHLCISLAVSCLMMTSWRITCWNAYNNSTRINV